MIVSYCVGSCTMKISDLDRRMKCLKIEWMIRLISLVLYFLISFISSVYLPKEFCSLFDGVFESRRTEDEMTTCIWQLFGFRMIFMLICLPIEFILFAVVVRHSKDLTFQLSLRKYLKPGYEGEFLKLQMNSIAFRINNEDESDVLLAKNNPEEVRHAILRSKYRAAILEKEREL